MKISLGNLRTVKSEDMYEKGGGSGSGCDGSDLLAVFRMSIICLVSMTNDSI